MDREKTMDSLEKQITDLENSIETRVTEAIDSAKAEAKKSFDTSKSFSDRAHANDLQMKDVKIGNSL